MKKVLHVTLLIIMTVLASKGWAQSGLVRGRITDASNGETLAGALVEAAGNLRTSTNVNGEFTLTLGAGSHQLTVHYLGYTDTTLQVAVTAGKVNFLNIRLSSTYRELSGVIITGTLQGQAKALNQQKSADNIKNVVAADQIGRFPDPNAAEALQRIPGINIERDQGEGRYVLVRGLAPQFTNISVNGEQIPSPEADVRFVALDAIPSDQLASIEVSKSLTPDMDGDAIGGSVNLITRTAQSAAPSFSASLLGGYNELMQKGNMQGSLQYDQRFGKQQQTGLLLNTTWYSNNLGSDNWEREPFDNELELRDYELTRTRLGLSGSLDHRFNENHKLYVNGIYTRFTDREWRRATLFAPEDDETVKAIKDRFEAQSVSSINAGAVHTFPKININYEFQYSNGRQNTPYDHGAEFIAEVPSVLNFSDRNFPSLDAPGYLDNSLYEFNELSFGKTLAKDRNITAKFNAGIPYKTGDGSGLLQFGAKVRFKKKSYEIVQEVYEARNDIPGLPSFEGGLLDDHFLKGRYRLSAPISANRVLGYYNQHPEDFELQIEDKAIDEALESYTAKEDVTAAYLMTRHQYEQLMLLAGVRYEHTKVSYTSSDVVIAPNGDLSEIRPVTGGSSYDFFLPQIHARYALDRNTNIRAAATMSYARPNFIDIVPAQEANLEDREATVGNTALKPVSALNLDLLGEHYFGNVGIISGGIFYKRLNDFIYPRVLFNSQYPLTGTPVATGIRVTQSQNGESADLIGFELTLQRNLNFLPGVLSGLSLYANYTYTHSDAKIQNREREGAGAAEFQKIRLPGQTANVGNLSLGYERKRFSGRVALNFNGEYLSEVGGAPQEDLYVASRVQLDANASYTLNKNFRIFAEALNLTNQAYETYTGNKDVVTQREFYSWWSRIGLKFDF